MSKIFEKFSRDEDIIAIKAAEDPTIDCLKEKTPSWKDIDDVVDAGLKRKNLNDAKLEAEPHGHSLEAVANFQISKLLSEDLLYFFQFNDRNLNRKPIFVLKMSKVHTELAIAMDRDNPAALLNAAYCFGDGMFKRCPGFVTLSYAFAYVGLLRMMVKLCTMEA